MLSPAVWSPTNEGTDSYLGATEGYAGRVPGPSRRCGSVRVFTQPGELGVGLLGAPSGRKEFANGSVHVGCAIRPLKERSDLCEQCLLCGRGLAEDDVSRDDKSNSSSCL